MNPIDHAQRAAEEIRSLNHTSHALDAYEWPGDVDIVTGALHALVSRLPQALAQMGVWLEYTHVAGGIGHDEGMHPEDAISAVLADLGEAMGHAARLATALGQMRATTYHLNAPTNLTPPSEGVPW